jgi:hypothetical protein
MSTSAEHEALVARFMKQRSKEEPDLVREVCERHPVLSDRQMRRREETEIPLSQLSSRELRRVTNNQFYSDSEEADE